MKASSPYLAAVNFKFDVDFRAVGCGLAFDDITFRT